LSRNEKFEQHIRKKTHKPNALRFWVEGGVTPLYGLTLISFLFVFPRFPLRILPTSGTRPSRKPMALIPLVGSGCQLILVVSI